MKYFVLFAVFNVFMCHTSVSSVLASFVAQEEQSEVPSCHIISGNHSKNSDSQESDENNFGYPEAEISSSCCLLSLINAKDLDSNYISVLFSIDTNIFFEQIFVNDSKIKIPLLKVGYDPPDLIIQKSSFLI